MREFVDQATETFMPNSDPAMRTLFRVTLYIIVFVAAPILVITSFPWLIGIVAAIGLIVLLLFGLRG